MARLSHYMQLQMQLDIDNPTPVYRVDTDDDTVNLEDALKLDVLDRTERNVLIKTDQQQGYRHVYTGMLSIDILHNNLLQITMPYSETATEAEAPSASEYLAQIALAIGYNYSLRGTDFIPAIDSVKKTQTGKVVEISGKLNDVLGKVFGWSRDVPEMQYIPHIDGNVLTVTQRGREAKTVNIDNFITGLPTITREKLHTEWGLQTTGDKNIYCGDTEENNVPFTGTVSWLGHTIVYENGYVTSETITPDLEEPTETVTTTYTYTGDDDEKYIATKVITDTVQGIVTTTTYTYETTDNNKYLAKEETQKVEDGEVTEKIVKITTPHGNGFYSHDVYDITDGNELISTNMGIGASGMRVSPYMVKSANDAIKTGKKQEEEARLKCEIDGVAKARSVYPVRDYGTLEQIATSLDDSEGKTEETLSAEIVGINSVIDFDTKISYKGNDYYLCSNTVTITPHTRRQMITAKRWYRYA